MQSSTPSPLLTSTFVLAGTALVLSVSLALIKASLFILKYLELPQITIPTIF